MTAIADLVGLGFTVGVAYGDAAPEYDRLAELEAATDPDALAEGAQNFANDAAAYAREIGITGEAAIAAIAGAYQSAFSNLGDLAQAAVDQQQRVIEVAEAMTTVYRVEGFGCSLLVAEDDTDTIESLAVLAGS